ncbi:MAG: ParB/RepB/Spo0J family partition protein [Bacilli bacterium]|nr:ParB/RepB/Spo0J family partition protein [Bacilli bacterium]
MKEKEKKELARKKFSVDDFFTTQEQRDDEKKEKVNEIDISLIDDFPNHPFKVLENEELKKLAESIYDTGVLVPTLVRPKADGRYEMISGHRRKKASEIAGIKTIPCIVRELTDDEATIIMVDSNLQREKILPSEKAFAYKMRNDALNHQGQRNDLTSDRIGQKLNSRDIIASKTDDSSTQIQRYIRLTFLIPELLEMVDNAALGEKPCISFSPAIEISYLQEDEQLVLLDTIEFTDATPSLSQAIRLKKLSQEAAKENKILDSYVIEDILGEEKPNQIPKLKFDESKIRKVLPKGIDNNDIEDFVVKSIEYYTKHLRQRSSEAR